MLCTNLNAGFQTELISNQTKQRNFARFYSRHILGYMSIYCAPNSLKDTHSGISNDSFYSFIYVMKWQFAVNFKCESLCQKTEREKWRSVIGRYLYLIATFDRWNSSNQIDYFDPDSIYLPSVSNRKMNIKTK